MPIQLTIFERRDNIERLNLGNAAFSLCKAIRAHDGIISSRYYWYGTDTVVIMTEGSAAALDSLDSAEVITAAYNVTDLARMTTHWRLMDPQVGVENYQKAGR